MVHEKRVRAGTNAEMTWFLSTELRENVRANGRACCIGLLQQKQDSTSTKVTDRDWNVNMEFRHSWALIGDNVWVSVSSFPTTTALGCSSLPSILTPSCHRHMQFYQVPNTKMALNARTMIDDSNSRHPASRQHAPSRGISGQTNP